MVFHNLRSLLWRKRETQAWGLQGEMVENGLSVLFAECGMEHCFSLDPGGLWLGPDDSSGPGLWAS